MSINSPSVPGQSQSFLGRLKSIVGPALRIFLRKTTYVKVFHAVDFLLSNEIYTYASAIAFNVLIAFFPAAIVVLTLVSFLGGPGLFQAALSAIVDYIPANQDFFQRQIATASQNFSGMTLLSLAILLFSAVGIFVPVELALNYVWKEKDGRHWAMSQLMSFGLLFFFILMTLVPVSLTWLVTSALEFVFFFLKGTAFLKMVEWLFMKIITIPFTVLAFAITYTVLPKRKMKMEEIVPAALFAGVVFEIGKHIYVLCLPLLQLREVYGAFSVSVTFITWALFAAMMLLMGAYLTHQELLPKFRWGGGNSQIPNPKSQQSNHSVPDAI